MPDRGNSLFSPLSIGTLSIPGRVIKTATSETRATADGVAGPEPGGVLRADGDGRDGADHHRQHLYQPRRPVDAEPDGGGRRRENPGLAELTPGGAPARVADLRAAEFRRRPPGGSGVRRPVRGGVGFRREGADDRHPAAAALPVEEIERIVEEFGEGGAALPGTPASTGCRSTPGHGDPDQPVPDALHQPAHRWLRRLARRSGCGCCAEVHRTIRARTGGRLSGDHQAQRRRTALPLRAGLKTGRTRRGRAADAGGRDRRGWRSRSGTTSWGSRWCAGASGAACRGNGRGQREVPAAAAPAGVHRDLAAARVVACRPDLAARRGLQPAASPGAFKAALSHPGDLRRRLPQPRADGGGARGRRLRRGLLRPGVHRRSVPLPAPARVRAPDRRASTAPPASA